MGQSVRTYLSLCFRWVSLYVRTSVFVSGGSVVYVRTSVFVSSGSVCTYVPQSLFPVGQSVRTYLSLCFQWVSLYVRTSVFVSGGSVCTYVPQSLFPVGQSVRTYLSLCFQWVSSVRTYLSLQWASLYVHTSVSSGPVCTYIPQSLLPGPSQ